VADAVSGGRAWVEKIRLLSRLPAAARAHAGRDDPIAECLRLTGELLDEPQRLHAFTDAALRELLGKLPAALRTGPQSIGLEDPAVLSGLLREAEAMLLERLSGDPA
jgi:hypothetical protein